MFPVSTQIIISSCVILNIYIFIRIKITAGIKEVMEVLHKAVVILERLLRAVDTPEVPLKVVTEEDNSKAGMAHLGDNLKAATARLEDNLKGDMEALLGVLKSRPKFNSGLILSIKTGREKLILRNCKRR